MLGAFVLIAGTVAAWVTVFATWRAARETRRAAQAQIVASLLDEYSTPEMLAAISIVLRWTPGTPIELNDEFDRARRRVSHHFQKIVALVTNGLLDARLLPMLVSKTEADLFCGPIQDIERQNNPGYDRSAFERLARLYLGHPNTRPLLPPR
jgi:hypothetical protein